MQKSKRDKGAPVPPLPTPLPPGNGRLVVLICCALILTSLAVYARTYSSNFVDFDDPAYIHHNPPVRSGLSLDGIVWAFVTVSHYYWQPLTWISHMLDVSLFGLNPGPHHMMSVAIHALNMAALFLALWRLTGALWTSAGAAALHALHPLRVESVAWVAERKDVLSGLFFSLSLLAYAGYAKKPGRRSYLWLLAAAAAAMMSKPTAVVLPGVLLLVDWWPLRRMSTVSSVWPLVREKIPIMLISGVVSLLTVLGAQEKFMIPLYALPLDARIWNAIWSYGCYLLNFAFPVNLGAFYPHHILSAEEKAVAFAVLIGLSAGAWMLRRSAPYLLMGWLLFLGAMIPMSGLAQSGDQAYADRFTYLPAIGLAVAVCWGIADLAAHYKVSARVLAVAAIVPLVVLAAMSWRQTAYWTDTRAMAGRALAVTTDNYRMDLLLGELSEKENKFDEALRHYLDILRTYPENWVIQKRTGNLYFRRKEYSQALDHYQAAAAAKPDELDVRKRMALTLARLDRPQEAISQLQIVLSQTPGDPEATQWMKAISGSPATVAAGK